MCTSSTTCPSPCAQIHAAHQQLMAYTQTTPSMLCQVDSQQYSRLNAKYHHYLMQYEKDEQTLKKKMEMFQRLDSIVLKSDEVQQELKNIEEIGKTLEQVGTKRKVVQEHLSRCNEETEGLMAETERLKGELLRTKNMYFQARNAVGGSQGISRSGEISIKKSLTTGDWTIKNKRTAQATLSLCNQSPKLNTTRYISNDLRLQAAQAVSSLKACLRKLTARILNPANKNINLAIDNIRIRKKVTQRHKMDFSRSELLGWGGKQIIQKAYESANKSPFLRPIDKTNSRTFKSKLEDWPSEMLLNNSSDTTEIIQSRCETGDLQKLNGKELFRLLCQDAEKLQIFEDSLHRRLRKNNKT